MSIFSPSSHTSSSKLRGFTLIELLVVIAIVMVITSLILFRHSRFDSTTLLRSLSYRVALTMRQAQVYGTSVREVRQSGATIQAPAYGLHFNSAPTSFIFFADRDDRGDYDGATELVNTSTLGRSFTIRAFCAVPATGDPDCYTNDSTANDDITTLTIYFRRPNPEAIIRTSAGTGYSYAYIQFQSSSDPGFRTVKVTSTGQIAVCGLNADPAAC